MMDDMIVHVSIMKLNSGYRVSARYKPFCDKYSAYGIEVNDQTLFKTMWEIADFLENECKVGCLFYVV